MIPRFECHRVMPDDVAAEVARKSQLELAGGGTDRQQPAAVIEAAELHNESHKHLVRGDRFQQAIRGPLEEVLHTGDKEQKLKAVQSYLVVYGGTRIAEALIEATDLLLPESLQGHQAAQPSGPEAQ